MDSPATRTRAAAVSTTAAAATTAATGALLRLVDSQRTTAHVLAVQALNGARCISVRHFNEPKAAWPTGIPVIDQGNGFHFAVLFKQFTNRSVVRRKWQVAHINLSHLQSLTNKARRAVIRDIRPKQTAVSTPPEHRHEADHPDDSHNRHLGSNMLRF